jgi:2-C-methyl-D-erythritol 4-phosphate cytidylyltransferase
VEIAFVVLAPGDADFKKHDWSVFGERLAPLYCGGATRRESVLNGIIACASLVDSNDWMLFERIARALIAADICDKHPARGKAVAGIAVKVDRIELCRDA